MLTSRYDEDYATIPRTCRPVSSGIHPVGPRVFIFGSARSGTTLLLNLFRSFEDAVVRDGEHCVSDLLVDDSRSCVVVKRTPRCAEHLRRDVPHFQDIWIIDIVRDPRDVVTSKLDGWPGYYCDFSRWARDVQVTTFLRGRHLKLLHLRFEQLLARSDDLQQQLAEILDLRVLAPFSSFPDSIPSDVSPQALAALGGLRPLALDRVGRWRRDRASRLRVAEQLKTYGSMEPLLRATGYSPTETETLI